jgi:hypothetical protein
MYKYSNLFCLANMMKSSLKKLSKDKQSSLLPANTRQSSNTLSWANTLAYFALPANIGQSKNNVPLANTPAYFALSANIWQCTNHL